MFRDVDHRIFGDFRARPGGGRDRHERQRTGFQLTTRSHHLQIVDQRAGGGDQRRNRLTSVNHRAAAEADHCPDAFLARQLDALLDVAEPGFAAYRQRRDLQLQRLQLMAQKRRPLRAGAMHQQNGAALLRQPGGSAQGLTTAKTNICGHQNGKRGQHVGFLFGKQAGINYTHYPLLCLVAGWQG